MIVVLKRALAEIGKLGGRLARCRPRPDLLPFLGPLQVADPRRMTRIVCIGRVLSRATYICTSAMPFCLVVCGSSPSLHRMKLSPRSAGKKDETQSSSVLRDLFLYTEEAYAHNRKHKAWRMGSIATKHV